MSQAEAAFAGLKNNLGEGNMVVAQCTKRLHRMNLMSREVVEAQTQLSGQAINGCDDKMAELLHQAKHLRSVSASMSGAKPIDVVYSSLRSLFERYDVDRSLCLEYGELVQLIEDYFKAASQASQWASMPAKGTVHAEDEVLEILEKYDVEGTQSLQWDQVLLMVAENPQYFELEFDSNMQAGLLGKVCEEYKLILQLQREVGQLSGLELLKARLARASQAFEDSVKKVYTKQRFEFDEYDADVNGYLNIYELASLIKGRFPVANKGKTIEHVQQQLEVMIKRFGDAEKGGLEWDEYVLMICLCSNRLGLYLHPSVTAGLLSLAYREYVALTESQTMIRGPGHLDVLLTRMKAANLMAAQGQVDEARVESGTVLAELKELLGESDPVVVQSQRRLDCMAIRHGSTES